MAKSAILLHPGTRLNKNFASHRQNYAQKMQDAQVTKSLGHVAYQIKGISSRNNFLPYDQTGDLWMGSKGQMLKSYVPIQGIH